MSAARDAILAAIRDARTESILPSVVAPAYRRAGARTREELLAQFAERLHDYGVVVRRVSDDNTREAIDELAVGRIGIPPGLEPAWRPRQAVEDDVLTPGALDGLDGVLTGCTVAISETGTIVLSGAPNDGRRVLTLVPDLHVCVVRAAQVVETVPEALDALRDRASQPLTFISGPSATSDIELQRVNGVHGPRRLAVILSGDG